MTQPKRGLIHTVVCWLIGAFVFIILYTTMMALASAWDKAEREYERNKIERFYKSRWCVVR